MVPTPTLGMAIGSRHHRDTGARRHRQPRERRFAAWGNWSRDRWCVVVLSLEAKSQSRILQQHRLKPLGAE